MGSIQSRQAAIGYQTANQRPSCRDSFPAAEVGALQARFPGVRQHRFFVFGGFVWTE